MITVGLAAQIIQDFRTAASQPEHFFQSSCYSSRFPTTSVAVGNLPDLDDWLKTKAGQQERANNTRTFLAVEGMKVIAFPMPA